MPETPIRILIVEDDMTSAAVISDVVRELGAEPTHVTRFEDGLESAKQVDFDVIVFDRMLPGGDGMDAIPILRAHGSTALIMIVSALGRAENRIQGLEQGADDYLAKPFDKNEMRARLRALLRRAQMVVLDNDLIAFGDIEIRSKARTVHIGQTNLPMSPKEFELLLVFAKNQKEIVTRMQLLEQVWNLHFDPQTNVVDVHVGRLRRKLEALTKRPVIFTARGEGYVFDPTGASEVARS